MPLLVLVVFPPTTLAEKPLALNDEDQKIFISIYPKVTYSLSNIIIGKYFPQKSP